MPIRIRKIEVPKEQIPVLISIAGLKDSDFESLVSALRSANPTLTRSKFIKTVEDAVQFAGIGNLPRILDVLFVLYVLKDRYELSVEDFADLICNSIKESIEEDTDFPTEKNTLLYDRLKQILQFDSSLAVTAKANDIMTDHEHIFCSGRILSDIRPVFAGKVNKAQGAVIIHNLKIGFHDGSVSDHKEFYVALDTDDLQRLKEIIERAEQKTTALQSILEKSNVPYLKV